MNKEGTYICLKDHSCFCKYTIVNVIIDEYIKSSRLVVIEQKPYELHCPTWYLNSKEFKSLGLVDLVGYRKEKLKKINGVKKSL